MESEEWRVELRLAFLGGGVAAEGPPPCPPNCRGSIAPPAHKPHRNGEVPAQQAKVRYRVRRTVGAALRRPPISLPIAMGRCLRSRRRGAPGTWIATAFGPAMTWFDIDASRALSVVRHRALEQRHCEEGEPDVAIRFPGHLNSTLHTPT